MGYAALMAVYDKELPAFFQCAIQSVMEQTLPPEEFVIVCDGPLTESLNSVLSHYEQKYPGIFHIVRLKESKGLGPALREGVTACGCELIMRMDSDDISLKDRAALQLKYMEDNPEIGVVGGFIDEFVGEGNVIAQRCVPLTPAEIRKTLRFRNPVNHVTVMMRKSVILQSGNYMDVPGFEDYHLWVRVLKQHEIANLQNTLCLVRCDQMMERRGGLQYFQNTKRFMNYLREEKIISAAEYIRNVLIRFCASVLLPPGIRASLFRMLMRRKIKHPAVTCYES